MFLCIYFFNILLSHSNAALIHIDIYHSLVSSFLSAQLLVIISINQTSVCAKQALHIAVDCLPHSLY